MNWWDVITGKPKKDETLKYRNLGIGNPNNYGGQEPKKEESGWPSLNKFAYVAGAIGDKLNPNGPLAGLGANLAQQRQYTQASEAAQKKQNVARQLLIDVLSGKEIPTPSGVPGLTSLNLSANKTGTPTVDMSYDLAPFTPAYKPEDNMILPANQQQSLYQQDVLADNMFTEGYKVRADMRQDAAMLKQRQTEFDTQTKQAEKQLAFNERREKAAEADRIADNQRLAEDTKSRMEDRETDNTLKKLEVEARIDDAKARRARQAEKDKNDESYREAKLGIEKRLTDHKIKIEQIKQGIDPETGNRIPKEEDKKRLLTKYQEIQKKDETIDDLLLLIGKGRVRTVGNMTTKDVTPVHIHTLNNRLATYAPESTNMAIMVDDEPKVIQLSQPIGKIYNALLKQGFTDSAIEEAIRKKVLAGDSNFSILTK